MSAIYANPPIIETLCEFHFEAGEPWDWTVPGLVYARVRHEFPDRAEQRTFQVDLQAGKALPPRVDTVAKMQFLRKDRSALIQVGPNVLVVNHLPPYPNWNGFRELIFNNFDYLYRSYPTEGCHSHRIAVH